MPITSNDIANQAIQLMGNDVPPPVVGQWPNFGGSPAADSLNILYGASAGLSVTKTVRAAGGSADCTLVFTGGLLTGGTC